VILPLAAMAANPAGPGTGIAPSGVARGGRHAHDVSLNGMVRRWSAKQWRILADVRRG